VGVTGPHDAIVLGRGSFAHVTDEGTQVVLLRALRKSSLVAPVLLSFALRRSEGDIGDTARPRRALRSRGANTRSAEGPRRRTRCSSPSGLRDARQRAGMEGEHGERDGHDRAPDAPGGWRPDGFGATGMRPPVKHPLQALTPARLSELLPELTAAEARKIVAAVHRDEAIDAPPRGVRRTAIERVKAIAEVPRLETVTERRSLLDPFRKLLLRAPDDQLIETVRIPLERTGRFTVCVSSQVGCALACTFCATGRMGLTRNLETWEILEQVRAVRRTLDRDAGERVHGVVFQGMGEPMANLDRVLDAIAVLSDPCALAVDSRGITVCTSGLPAGIRRLAREAPRVRLGWSLGSAVQEKRERLMPIARSHSLGDVLDAGEEHARLTGHAPLWAYTLLAGVNDDAADARALAAMHLGFAERTGVRPRLSIIPYNSIVESGDPFTRSSLERENAFRDELVAHGVYGKKRYSGGSDVTAACGQLAARG
jgi:23S rRNA (adenine2503-C2)-methyltransferase